MVLVEDMTDDAKRLGLNTVQIQTDVELKLRLAGIKVLTKEERYGTPGTPYRLCLVKRGEPSAGAHELGRP